MNIKTAFTRLAAAVVMAFAVTAAGGAGVSTAHADSTAAETSKAERLVEAAKNAKKALRQAERRSGEGAESEHIRKSAL